MRKFTVISALISVGIASAQRGTGDWMTSGSDAQRSSWIRSDGKISPKSMAKPGFALAWKLKLEDANRDVNSLMPPALLDFYIGYRGFRTLAFFAASSDKVVAVDTDLARTEWQNRYTPPGSQAAATSTCPGGMTSAVTRPTIPNYPPMVGIALGRGTPAKSGVGAPHEGSVVLSALAARPRTTPPPPTPATGKPAKPEPSPFAPHIQYLLALSGDGKLHTVWVSNGNEPASAANFIPPNAHAFGLIAYDDVAYVATSGDCGSAGNGVWSLDLESKKVNHWSSSKQIAGTAGPAVGPDGTQYVAAGNELVALSPRQLEVLAIQKNSGADFSSSPVVFEFRGKDLLAIATQDGRLNLFDTHSLNQAKALDRTEAPSSGGSRSDALASWQDPAGTRWVLAPGKDSIMAWKVVDKNGTPAFERGWVSRNLDAPLPPIVVNGVVFAVSSGEYDPANRSLAATERAQKSKPAVLYAFDGRSGQELWSSGNTINSFVHSGGLAAGGSRVYVSSYDGTQYAFGFPIEH